MEVVHEASSAVELVVETDAHEGPVYVAEEDALYFTTLPRRDGAGIPQVAIKRLGLATRTVTTLCERTRAANGMTLAPDGALLACEQGTPTQAARIARFDRATGEAETVVEEWNGLPLNSPNDVVVAADGSIWFTDPSYGFLQGFRPQPRVADAVYRWDGRLVRAAASFDKPNGLAFSPDGRTLYVGDNGAPHRLLAFDVAPDRTLSHERELAVLPPGHPDGVKVDAAGRVHTSSADGIRVFSPEGDPLAEIPLPGAVNFAFGGPESNVLFVTTDTAVWAVKGA
jgi:gluconolactonase